MDEYNFNDADNFNELGVLFEMIAPVLAKFFRALTKEGLLVQEAAALTAAWSSQMMPPPPVAPQED